ncbi:MAG: sugar phosphate isomerase/epimerase [Acidobacteria bacterium]|nr:sugar phosphate isomerase/epimerase [Acidobacteriota bacterium]
MRRVLSTRLFSSERLTTATLGRIERAGFHSVMLYGERWSLDYRQRGRIDELRSWFRDSPLDARGLIAPTTSDESGGGAPEDLLRITELDRPRRIKITDELKRVLEVADAIPYGSLILTLGSPEELYSDAAFDAAFNALDELQVMARHLDVELVLSNSANDLANADRLRQLLRFTHLPLGYAFDFPAAQAAGDLTREFETMAENIRVALAADGDNQRRPRRMPTAEEPVVDWKRGRDLLRQLNADKTLLALDVDPDPETEPLDAALRAFDFLEG